MDTRRPHSAVWVPSLVSPSSSSSHPMSLLNPWRSLPWCDMGIIQPLVTSYSAEVTPIVIKPSPNLCWVLGQLMSAGVFLGTLFQQGEWPYRLPPVLRWLRPLANGIAVSSGPDRYDFAAHYAYTSDRCGTQPHSGECEHVALDVTMHKSGSETSLVARIRLQPQTPTAYTCRSVVHSMTLIR